MWLRISHLDINLLLSNLESKDNFKNFEPVFVPGDKVVSVMAVCYNYYMIRFTNDILNSCMIPPTHCTESRWVNSRRPLHRYTKVLCRASEVSNILFHQKHFTMFKFLFLYLLSVCAIQLINFYCWQIQWAFL